MFHNVGAVLLPSLYLKRNALTSVLMLFFFLLFPSFCIFEVGLLYFFLLYLISHKVIFLMLIYLISSRGCS